MMGLWQEEMFASNKKNANACEGCRSWLVLKEKLIAEQTTTTDMVGHFRVLDKAEVLCNNCRRMLNSHYRISGSDTINENDSALMGQIEAAAAYQRAEETAELVAPYRSADYEGE